MEPVKDFIKRKKQERLNSYTYVRDIKAKGRHKWKVQSITFMPQTNSREKVFVIERLGYLGADGQAKPVHRIGRRYYRIGYWIIGKKGNKKNRWAWGQFCPFIPVKDLEKLLSKAKKEKTIISV